MTAPLRRLALGALLFGLVACSQGTFAPSGDAVSHGAPKNNSPRIVAVTLDDATNAKGAVVGRPHFMRLESFAERSSSAVGYPLNVVKGPGPIMTSSAAYNVYVNCRDESCWGHPEEFLKILATSRFTQTISQYTGSHPSSYRYADSVSITYKHPYSRTYYNEDLMTILSAAVRQFGKTGLNVEYHIFLPKGTDTCFDQSSMCYSPDHLSAFQFCAYHDSAKLRGAVVLYSVEPYQDVDVTLHGKQYPACHVPSTVNNVNALDSATDSTLGHESFESWSDPEPNSGWYNALYGDEIADMCSYYFMTYLHSASETFFIQEIYSNRAHGCVY